MEKRAVLAVVLSLLVLLGYQYIFAPKEPIVAEKAASISGTQEKTAEPAGAKTPALEHPKAEGAMHPSLPQGEGLAGKDIIVETDTIRAVLNTKSASVKSWTLKRYKDKANGIVSVELVPPGKRQLELVSTENGSQSPDNLIYVSDKESLNGAGSITFTAMRPDGTKVRKTFTFTENSYKAGLNVSYENTGSSVITERPALSMSMISKVADRGELFHEMAFLSGKDLKRIHADKIKDEKAGSGEIEWAYLGDKYFITAVMPTSGGDAEVYSKKVGEELFEASLVFRSLQIKPGETKVMEYGLYFGPKEVGILKAAGSKLERAIDLGFFDLIAYPMLLSFKWMYEVIPNYGVVVILLTVLIKILFWPLSQKSYKSMKDMQKVAPLMEQIREKYKDDKERLNKEVMDLYKRHKVNPLGGCLPMILQIPVFFALYAVVGGAVELRHAPFILWITDLSAKDPYYVTPVIMGATMFIQQKMTPSATADPMQQKVMMLMPVIFTFMFLNFSSGLVLYWLINNVLSIGQQHYVNKYIK
ncbi:MAG: yidC [Deltaproteobacteria bacterium]|nr:yidC [Deltaproteobacteria bacterium]MBM2837600.1 yidC [Deltaproteobacteria bacterium]